MTLDRPCSQHPERDAVVHCQKYDRYLCEECIACRQPKNHCKHRTACLIWEFEKHGRPGDIEEEDPGSTAKTPTTAKSGV
ncbi:MAG: hypothetical protein ABI333_09810 [bacterium]